MAEQYYLAFENKKELGLLDKLNTSRLNLLLETNKKTNSTEAVLVSACHSQSIGEVFLNAGIPIVIAVNSPFKILDEAARAFSKAFHSSLVQG